MDLINTFPALLYWLKSIIEFWAERASRIIYLLGQEIKKNVFFVGIVNGIRIIVNLIMAWLTQEKSKLKTSSLFATKVDFEEFVQPVFYLTF